MKKRRRAGRQAGNIFRRKSVQKKTKRRFFCLFFRFFIIFPGFVSLKQVSRSFSRFFQKLGDPPSFFPYTKEIGGEICQKRTMSN